MRTELKYFSVMLLVFLFSGCSRIKYDRELATISQRSSWAIGQDIELLQAGQLAGAQEKLGQRLLEPVSVQQAVGLALKYNIMLQADFEELGIVKADLEIAGLYTNPRVEGLFRIPNFHARDNLEAHLSLNVADWWLVPMRRKVSKTHLEALTYRIMTTILEVKKKVQRAFDSCQYAQLHFDKGIEMHEMLENLYQRVLQRQQFGFSSEFDIAQMSKMVGEQNNELHRLESQLRLSYIALRESMGARPTSDPILLHEDPEKDQQQYMSHLPEVDYFVRKAFAQRPELEMARLHIEELEHKKVLDKAEVFSDVSLGISVERGPEGRHVAGPTIGVDIPLFNRGDAHAERVRFMLSKARKRYHAQRLAIEKEVKTAYESIVREQQIVSSFQDRIIPDAQKALEYARKHSKTMQLSRIIAMRAEVDIYEAEQHFIAAVHDLADGFTDLERAVGVSLEHGIEQF